MNARVLQPLRPVSGPIKISIVAELVVLAAALLGAGILLSGASQRERTLAALDVRLTNQAALRGSTLEKQIDKLRRDAIFLANVPPIEGIAHAASHRSFDPQGAASRLQWEERLRAIFISFINANENVLGVRYVGVAAAGRELVRVDRKGSTAVAVANDQLRSHADRSYFGAALKLNKGETYVSDIDFNREEEAASVPHIPTLRVATPVFVHDDELFGLIVVSIDARSMLSDLTANQPTGFDTYLVNGSGGYLVSPVAGKAFAFEFGRSDAWQNDFRASSRPTEVRSLRRFDSSLGVLHAAPYRIRIDAGDARRDLTLYYGVPDEFVKAEERSAELSSLLYGAGGLVILGGLVFLYLRGSHQRWRASIEAQRMAAIVESSSDAIIGKNLKGVITSWNRGAERIFGFSAQEAIGRSILGLIAPEERREEEEEILRRICEGERVPHFITQRRRKDGRTIDVAVTVSPICSADGRVIGASKTARDVTELKAAETALQDTRERLAIATKVNGIAVWEWNPLTDELIVDDTMFELYRRRREDFATVREAWNASIHPDDLEQANAALRDAIKGVKPLDARFRIVTPGGEIRHIRTRAKVFFDAIGVATQVLGTNYDCTEEVEREQRVDELNSTLEAQVAARTADLSTANEALLAYSAMVSHDLRAPVTIINQFARDLEESLASRLQPIERRDLSVIRDTGEKMNRLIDDLLNFARLGNQPISFEQVDMEAIVNAAWTELFKQPQAHKVELRRAVLPNAHGDPALIKQVWFNLIDNAIKYSGKRARPSIEVGAMETDREIVYSVRDNGVGFAAKHAERLFDAFQRFHSASEFSGSGMGLAIVRRIVTRHGGRVWAESEENEGATFFFSLPKIAPDS